MLGVDNCDCGVEAGRRNSQHRLQLSAQTEVHFAEHLVFSVVELGNEKFFPEATTKPSYFK